MFFPREFSENISENYSHLSQCFVISHNTSLYLQLLCSVHNTSLYNVYNKFFASSSNSFRFNWLANRERREKRDFERIRQNLENPSAQHFSSRAVALMQIEWFLSGAVKLAEPHRWSV